MNEIIDFVRTELKRNIDPERAKSSQNYFKEKIVFYGVKVPTVHTISKTVYKSLKTKTKAEIFDLCEILWKSGNLEESLVASDWSYFLRKKYTPEDFTWFEKWINKYINNWASCDSFCNHTVGDFIMMYPQFISKLKTFTQSENRWMRRAAAVSLIVPARRGMFLNEILEIANLLLTDKDDMVQKGYGWMLKVASESHQKEIFDFVMQNKSRMPRTSLRYAIEKMPKDLKELALAKS